MANRRSSKSAIMNTVNLLSAFAAPSEEHAAVLISYGLAFMDSRWFYTAVPAYATSRQDGLSEESRKKLVDQYDPWPYFEKFLDQYSGMAHQYLDVWWEHIEKVVQDPYRLVDILKQKPENMQYLDSPDGFQYVEFISRQLYDKIYEWNWPED